MSASQYHGEHNHDLFLFFFNMSHSEECHTSFPSWKYNVLVFSGGCYNPCTTMEKDSLQKSRIISKTQTASTCPWVLLQCWPVLFEFRTQQICQVRRASMAASTYNSNDGHIKELVTFLFGERIVSVAMVNSIAIFSTLGSQVGERPGPITWMWSYQPSSISPHSPTACWSSTVGHGKRRWQCPKTITMIPW